MPKNLKGPTRRRADNPLMVSPLGRGPGETPVYSPSSAKGSSTPAQGEASRSQSAKDQRRGG